MADQADNWLDAEAFALRLVSTLQEKYPDAIVRAVNALVEFADPTDGLFVITVKEARFEVAS